MYPKLVLVLVALPALITCQPTHCEKWKGDWEFRCLKSNYGADSINIRNIVNRDVSFKIAKWMSICGKPGANYASSEHHLGPHGSHDEVYIEAEGHSCNELFIYECKRGSEKVHCLDILTPSVN